jgi:hypothetical protein
VFDLTRVRNFKKTSFFVFCRFFDFLCFRHADVAQTSRNRRVKRRANAISSFRRCFVSHDQCDRDTQMPFGVSLKECFSNFLRDFFFFADFVGRSNGWLNAVAYMIRLKLAYVYKAHKYTSHITRHIVPFGPNLPSPSHSERWILDCRIFGSWYFDDPFSSFLKVPEFTQH